MIEVQLIKNSEDVIPKSCKLRNRPHSTSFKVERKYSIKNFPCCVYRMPLLLMPLKVTHFF